MTAPRRPTALTTSAAFGAVGVVLLLAGWLTGSTAVALVGVVAGTLSLIAALWWRSQLIAAWRARHHPPR